MILLSLSHRNFCHYSPPSLTIHQWFLTWTWYLNQINPTSALTESPCRSPRCLCPNCSSFSKFCVCSNCLGTFFHEISSVLIIVLVFHQSVIFIIRSHSHQSVTYSTISFWLIIILHILIWIKYFLHILYFMILPCVHDCSSSFSNIFVESIFCFWDSALLLSAV